MFNITIAGETQLKSQRGKHIILTLKGWLSINEWMLERIETEILYIASGKVNGVTTVKKFGSS
jgi:hypothetical protein